MAKYEDQFNNTTNGNSKYNTIKNTKQYNSKIDIIVNQLFLKQFTMPTSNKWVLPELKTMLSCSKWEVNKHVSMIIPIFIIKLPLHF
jgi:hypothetical protein